MDSVKTLSLFQQSNHSATMIRQTEINYKYNMILLKYATCVSCVHSRYLTQLAQRILYANAHVNEAIFNVGSRSQ